MSIIRYVRVFFKALGMTLRGEKPQSPVEQQYPHLTTWLNRAKELVHQAFHSAETNGIDETKRKAIVVKVDGRMMSMETILSAVRYHVENEYSYLLRNITEHSLTALYASNLNDRYWVMRLVEYDDIPLSVRNSIQELGVHLDNIPSSTNP